MAVYIRQWSSSFPMMYSWKMHIKHLMHMGLSHILNPMKWKKISHTYMWLVITSFSKIQSLENVSAMTFKMNLEDVSHRKFIPPLTQYDRIDRIDLVHPIFSSLTIPCEYCYMFYKLSPVWRVVPRLFCNGCQVLASSCPSVFSFFSILHWSWYYRLQQLA